MRSTFDDGSMIHDANACSISNRTSATKSICKRKKSHGLTAINTTIAITIAIPITTPHRQHHLQHHLHHHHYLDPHLQPHLYLKRCAMTRVVHLRLTEFKASCTTFSLSLSLYHKTKETVRKPHYLNINHGVPLGSQCRCGFIKNQYSRSSTNCTGNGNPLLLSSRKPF